MKRFSEQLHKKSETVKLRAAEKRDLRERLVAYMEYHPLPAALKQKNTKQAKTAQTELFTEAFTTVTIPFSNLFKGAAATAVLLLVLMPFVAERAVPGDTLYAVKVQFNEELRSSLTFDTYQKVEWETERLNRRIAEARLLASEGRLTEEVEAEVAAAVRVHTDNAKREIEELRITDADEAAIASIALDTTLEVQSTSLTEKDTGSDTDDSATNLIVDVINQSRADTVVQNASATPPVFGKLMARVEQNTTRIYELLSTLENTTPATELVDVKRRAADIERAVVEAVALSDEDDTAARLALIAVLQRTQRLIVYMTELQVTEEIDIETLLPVVLTTEEETVVRAERTAQLNKKVSSIEKLQAVVEDASVLEKTAIALSTIDELSVTMVASSTSFTTFQLTATEALEIADDMFNTLQRSAGPAIGDVILPEVETATTSASSTLTEQATSTAPVEEQATSTDEITIEDTATSTDQVDNV